MPNPDNTRGVSSGAERVGYRESLSLVSPAELGERTSNLSEIIDPARYEDPLWISFHRDLESYSTDKHVFRHVSGEVVRKGYEWTQCIYGLALLGALKPDARALGVGAGHEPVIFWLADRVAHVTATDLYGNEDWQNSPGAEGSAEVFVAPEQYCPRPVSKEKITFQTADGTRLPFADDSFDFCWSLSSIEHFGGHEASASAMREMARVTKPGGIVCVATEVLLRNWPGHPEFFTPRDFLKYILRGSDELALVDPMNWSKPPQEYLDDPIVVPDEIGRRRRHVVLRHDRFDWTSAIAFLRKGDRRAPAWLDYARALLPPATRTSPPPQAYSLGRFHLHNGTSAALVAATVRVTTPEQPWAYAVEFPLQDGSVPAGAGLEIETVVRAQLQPARLGVLNAGGDAFIREIEVAPNVSAGQVKIVVPGDAPVGPLVIRSAAAGSSMVEFEIRSVKLLPPS